jgi:hypothetical protein
VAIYFVSVAHVPCTLHLLPQSCPLGRKNSKISIDIKGIFLFFVYLEYISEMVDVATCNTENNG